LAAIGVAVAALVGVGALLDIGPFADRADERPAVAIAVERLALALNEGDFATVCELLSEDRVREIERASGGRCAGVLAANSGAVEETRIRIEQVRVQADRAAVEAIVIRGSERTPETLLLIREGGDWKIASAGL
jgi:hypothetical protein